MDLSQEHVDSSIEADHDFSKFQQKDTRTNSQSKNANSLEKPNYVAEIKRHVCSNNSTTKCGPCQDSCFCRLLRYDEYCEPTEEETEYGDSFVSLTEFGVGPGSPCSIRKTPFLSRAHKSPLLREKVLNVGVLADLLEETNLEEGDAPVTQMSNNHVFSKGVPLFGLLDESLDLSSSVVKNQECEIMGEGHESNSYDPQSLMALINSHGTLFSESEVPPPCVSRIGPQRQRSADLSHEPSLDFLDLWDEESMSSDDDDHRVSRSYDKKSHNSHLSRTCPPEHDHDNQSTASQSPLSHSSNSCCYYEGTSREEDDRPECDIQNWHVKMPNTITLAIPGAKTLEGQEKDLGGEVRSNKERTEANAPSSQRFRRLNEEQESSKSSLDPDSCLEGKVESVTSTITWLEDEFDEISVSYGSDACSDLAEVQPGLGAEERGEPVKSSFPLAFEALSIQSTVTPFDEVLDELTISCDELSSDATDQGRVFALTKSLEIKQQQQQDSELQHVNRLAVGIQNNLETEDVTGELSISSAASSAEQVIRQEAGVNQFFSSGTSPFGEMDSVKIHLQSTTPESES